MMRSISLFCGAENSCAATGGVGASISQAAAVAPARRIGIGIMGASPRWKSLDQAARLQRTVARDVVRLHPAGRSYRKTAFRATGKLPGGRKISAIESRLGGGEVGIGEVALAPVGDGKMVIGVGDFRIALQGGAQIRNGLIDEMVVIGGKQRLAKQNADQ